MMKNNQKKENKAQKYIKALSNIYFYEHAPLIHSKLLRNGENILVSFCQKNTLLNPICSCGLDSKTICHYFLKCSNLTNEKIN